MLKDKHNLLRSYVSSVRERRDSELFNVRVVSELLGVSKASIYAYAASGALQAIRMPLTHASTATKRNKRTLRFRPEEIERFLKALEK